MIPYWLLFAYFALGALHETPRRSISGSSNALLVLGAVMIALLVGLRYQVGADWDTYEFMFSYARRTDIGRALEIGDPGYQILNWGVQNLGGEMWLVNLVCGVLFTWGLMRFAQVQSNPWLAVLVAVPYMIVVVAMGYSRQAVALGILMAGLASMKRNGSVLRFLAYVAAAALFHKTAVVAFPLVALASRRNRTINIFVAITASVLLYDMFLGDSMQQFVDNYIEAEYSSQGAAIRVAMIVVPAAMFLLFPNRFGFSAEERLMWRHFSLAAFGFLILLLTLPSSTAVDRMALYVMPLQLAVLSRMPGTIMHPTIGKFVIIAYSFAVQFVWLNFAVHSEYWVPYKFYPL